MLKHLRWVYITGMLAFPWAVWWGAKALGYPVPTWRLPGKPHLVGLFVFWGILWELMVLAPILELRGPIISWRREMAQWALYALFVASMSALFVGWVWGAMLIREVVVSLLPFLEGLEGLVQVFSSLGLAVAIFYGVGWLVERDLNTVLRTFLRYRLLRLFTTNKEELMALLEAVPLSSEAKAYYRDRLQGPVSAAVLQELLAEVGSLPAPQSFQEQLARLRLEQALINCLEEEGFRRWD